MIKYYIYGFFTIFLLIGAYNDFRRWKIPNWLNFTGFLVGVTCLAFNPLLSAWDGLLGGIFGFVFLLIATIICGGGFGAGDIKFLGVIGLFIGLQSTWYVIAFAYVIQQMYFFITKKKQAPFAPALSFVSLIITLNLI